MSSLKRSHLDIIGSHNNFGCRGKVVKFIPPNPKFSPYYLCQRCERPVPWWSIKKLKSTKKDKSKK